MNNLIYANVRMSIASTFQSVDQKPGIITIVMSAGITDAKKVTTLNIVPNPERSQPIVFAADDVKEGIYSLIKMPEPDMLYINSINGLLT